jgi:hypothetical protein
MSPEWSKYSRIYVLMIYEELSLRLLSLTDCKACVLLEALKTEELYL